MVVKFDNIWMVQFVHDLNFKLYLLDQIMFNNFCFADNFDGVNVLRNFVSDFVNLAESAYSNIAICQGLKVISTTLLLLT